MLGFFIPTHLAIILPQLHPCSEDMNLRKKREYGDRVQTVEFASFTPLVFSTFGGLRR